MLSTEARYRRFFELGSGPKNNPTPWRYRRECTSLRLAGCELLSRLIIDRQPTRVLDLGSGITSHIIRAFMEDQPNLTVVSTDTNLKWLLLTVSELRRDGLSTQHCYEQSVFEDIMIRKPEFFGGTFDLISVDIDNLSWRVDHAKDIARWLSPNGILALDDFGMETHTEDMTAALEALGFTVWERTDTADEYGCYMATAQRHYHT